MGLLCLFETPAGFALFNVHNEGVLDDVDCQNKLEKAFSSPEGARKLVSLKAFKKFDTTQDALAAAAALVDSKLPKSLKKFLSKHADPEAGDSLALADAKLGGIVKDKLNLPCIFSTGVQELMRGVRQQLGTLVAGLGGAAGGLAPMSLGLSHSLSRYKLKFSPDKVDTMVVQAIGLLDDLDKELNTYAMRVREWYGWHFPELVKVLNDNLLYAKAVRLMGMRTGAAATDFSEAGLDEQQEADLKHAAQVSMGTDISDSDMDHIRALADQVVALAEYRSQLYDYLKARMAAIAPNLTVLVGELVGARLIAHAGSLLALAKHPASTVQILGAEKALFRALKTKHDTPKYGLIYHASLVGASAPKLKGKISRVLAAKCALSIRVDALGDAAGATIGVDDREKVEARLRQLEGRAVNKAASLAKAAAAGGKGAPKAYDSQRQGAASQLLTTPKGYNAAADVIPNGHGDDDDGEDEAAAKAARKAAKKAKREREAAEAAGNGHGEDRPKKKKKAQGDD